MGVVNKIAKAGLVTLDLRSFIPEGDRVELDLINWLDNDLIIKESSFKKKLQEFNWASMRNAFVAVFCSKDVVVPPWAYLLIQTKLNGFARQVFFSDIDTMNLLLFQQELNKLDARNFKNKRVFLKACGGRDVPLEAFSMCMHKLMPCVKSLFYGEPCSGVPLIKN